MDDESTRRFEGKSVDELLADLTSPLPGSVAHEQIKAAIAVRIAQLQRDAARDALRWAKVTAVATACATLIALVAFLAAAI